MIRKFQKCVFGLSLFALVLFLAMGAGFVRAQTPEYCTDLDRPLAGQDFNGENVLVTTHGIGGGLLECNATTGELVNQFSLPGEFIFPTAISYSPSGEKILLADSSGNLLVLHQWETLSYHHVQSFVPYVREPFVSSVLWVNDDRLFVSVMSLWWNIDSLVFDVELGENALTTTSPYTVNGAIAYDMAFDESSGLLALTGANTRVIDTVAGTVVAKFDAFSSQGITFSPDGEYLVADAGNGVVRIWSTTDWHQAGTGTIENTIYDLAMFDRQVVVTTRQDGVTYVANLVDLIGQTLSPDAQTTQRVNTIFSPNLTVSGADAGYSFGSVNLGGYQVAFVSDNDPTDDNFRGESFINID